MDVRKVLSRVIPVLLLLLGAVVASAQTCRDPIWVRRLTAGLDTSDPETVLQAQQWINRWMNLTDETVARGMLRTIFNNDLKAISVTFKNLRPGDMPFLPGAPLQSQADEMYRVIGELTAIDGNFTPMDGLLDHVGKIMSDNRPAQMGALLDLRAADEVGLAQRLGTPGAGFEIAKEAPSPLIPDEIISRQMDIVDPLGFAHESKNWPNGLPRNPNGSVAEGILQSFEEEFRRDIVIFGTTPDPFDGYRLNFREATRAELDFLKARLDSQFLHPFVTSRIRSDQLARLKEQFDILWGLQDSGSLLRFFP